MTISLRPARPTDAGTTGDILHRGLPACDAARYSMAETLAFCGVMIDRGWMTVAEDQAQVLGFIARDGAEICALYLAPSAQGRGVGRMLLDAAKRQSDRLHLVSRADDARARRFYAKAGFRPAAWDADQIRHEWTRKAVA